MGYPLGLFFNFDFVLLVITITIIIELLGGGRMDGWVGGSDERYRERLYPTMKHGTMRSTPTEIC